MQVIADPNHRVEYPDIAIPRGATGQHGEAVDPTTLAVKVMPSAIDTMRSCLAYNKEQRLAIPALLRHDFLQPRLESQSCSPFVSRLCALRDQWLTAIAEPSLPSGTTTISAAQMRIMVNYVLSKGQCQVDMNDAMIEVSFLSDNC